MDDRVMEVAGTRVSTMEMPCFRITTSPESANLLLYTQNTYKEVLGCLAALASPHLGQCLRRLGDQCHFWTRASHI